MKCIVLLVGLSLHPGLWLVGFSVIFIAIATLLFRLSGRIEVGSSPSAVLDLATSLFGVCASGIFLYSFFPQLRPAWFVACTVVAGVASSALFRFMLKTPA